MPILREQFNFIEMRESPDYEPDDEDALQDEEFSDDQFLADVIVINLGLCSPFCIVQNLWSQLFTIL
jgi:hypothetical protein